MGLEPLHHIGRQAWDVDGAAGWQAQQHIADLLGHIDGHVGLSLFGGGSQMGREDQAITVATQR